MYHVLKNCQNWQSKTLILFEQRIQFIPLCENVNIIRQSICLIGWLCLKVFWMGGIYTYVPWITYLLLLLKTVWIDRILNQPWLSILTFTMSVNFYESIKWKIGTTIVVHIYAKTQFLFWKKWLELIFHVLHKHIMYLILATANCFSQFFLIMLGPHIYRLPRTHLTSKILI